MGFYIGGKVGPIGYSARLGGGSTPRKSAPREDDVLIGATAIAMLATFIGFIALGHWLGDDDGTVTGFTFWILFWVGLAVRGLYRALYPSRKAEMRAEVRKAKKALERQRAEEHLAVERQRVAAVRQEAMQIASDHEARKARR